MTQIMLKRLILKELMIYHSKKIHLFSHPKMAYILVYIVLTRENIFSKNTLYEKNEKI